MNGAIRKHKLCHFDMNCATVGLLFPRTIVHLRIPWQVLQKDMSRSENDVWVACGQNTTGSVSPTASF